MNYYGSIVELTARFRRYWIVRNRIPCVVTTVDLLRASRPICTSLFIVNYLCAAGSSRYTEISLPLVAWRSVRALVQRRLNIYTIMRD